MTTQPKPQRTVDATVKSKAEESDGWKLELDIPSFQSKFPTLVTRVPAKLADQLRPGGTYKVVLEVQKLKREGLDTSKPYTDQGIRCRLGRDSPAHRSPRIPPEAPGCPGWHAKPERG